MEKTTSLTTIRKNGNPVAGADSFFSFSPSGTHLSSYNADYSLYVVDYCPDNILRPGESTIQKYWFVCGHFYVLYYHAYTISQRTMAINSIICLASLCCNLLLLTLDEYNYPSGTSVAGLKSPVNCLLCLFDL